MKNRALQIVLIFVITLFAMYLTHNANASTDTNHSRSGSTQQLIYTDEHCSLMEWDAVSGESHLLYKRDGCPQRLFIQSSGNTAFLIYGDTLNVLDLTSPTSKVKTFDLPVPDLPKDLSKNSEVVAFVQYTIKGLMAIKLTYIYPWDSEEDYLYERVKDSWVLVNEGTCDGYGHCAVRGGKEKSNSINIEDGFATYEGIPYKNSTALYNLSDSNNPYLKSISSKSVDENDDEAGDTWTAKFSFGSHTSTLIYTVLNGPDSGLPSIFAISMITSDGRNITFSFRQCAASLLGRYLIVYGYQNMHTALIDLASGKVLLANMRLALWRQ
jgi:hypothetical protein